MLNDDASKTKAHDIPLPGKSVTGGLTGGTENVPWGTWVEVKQGQVMAPDTYVDDEGVLRTTMDDSTVVWHDVIKGVHCQRRGIKPEEIVYDPETNAPWCPECWQKRLEKKKELTEATKEWEKGEDDLGMTLWG